MGTPHRQHKACTIHTTKALLPYHRQYWTVQEVYIPHYTGHHRAGKKKVNHRFLHNGNRRRKFLTNQIYTVGLLLQYNRIYNNSWSLFSWPSDRIRRSWKHRACGHLHWCSCPQSNPRGWVWHRDEGSGCRTSLVVPGCSPWPNRRNDNSVNAESACPSLQLGVLYRLQEIAESLQQLLS